MYIYVYFFRLHKRLHMHCRNIIKNYITGYMLISANEIFCTCTDDMSVGPLGMYRESSPVLIRNVAYEIFIYKSVHNMAILMNISTQLWPYFLQRRDREDSSLRVLAQIQILLQQQHAKMPQIFYPWFP